MKRDSFSGRSHKPGYLAVSTIQKNDGRLLLKTKISKKEESASII